MGIKPSKKLAIVVLIVLCFRPHWLRADSKSDGIEVTYLGNEGFLVRSGSQAVLFDALFGAGLPDYDRVPATTVHDMETARSLFTRINAIFISHVHPDHFDLASTARFLKSHPETVVVAPSEVSELLRREFASNRGILSQIRTTPLQSGQFTTRDEGGVQAAALRLVHLNVENAAYFVLLNGKAVLHLGDADLPMKGLSQFKLSDRQIAVAFVPFWQLTENAKSVRNQIGAKVVVPMHLITNPIAESSKGYMDHVGGWRGMLARIRSEFPNAAIFNVPLETKVF